VEISEECQKGRMILDYYTNKGMYATRPDFLTLEQTRWREFELGVEIAALRAKQPQPGQK
jgi:hypothetical protein